MFESIFDGLMLGDGYLLMKKGSRNAIYGHSCKEYEYIEYIGDPETSCYRYKWDIQKYVGKQPKYS